MSLFPPSFVDDLKSQTDIVSVIGEVVSLRKAGSTFKGLCPFHQEKTPSFNVNGDKGFFKCFGCGAGGDVVTFVELHQKVPFPEAVRYLAQRAGMAVPEAQGGAEDRAAAASWPWSRCMRMRRCSTAKPRARQIRAQRELSRVDSRRDAQRLPLRLCPTSGEGHCMGDSWTRKSRSRSVSGCGPRAGRRARRRFLSKPADDPGARSSAVVAFGGRALDQGRCRCLNSPTPVY